MNFNKYRFSSKEWNANAGLYYYLYRFYDPDFQRWPNRDPLGEIGFQVLRNHKGFKPTFTFPMFVELIEGPNLYEYLKNDPTDAFDSNGLRINPLPDNPFDIPIPTGLSVECKNDIEMAVQQAKGCNLPNDPLDTYNNICNCMGDALGATDYEKEVCGHQMTNAYNKKCNPTCPTSPGSTNSGPTKPTKPGS